MYCVGRDVDVDLVQAHKWFNLAALRATRRRSAIGREISKEMSKLDIARAQKLAREWIATQ